MGLCRTPFLLWVKKGGGGLGDWGNGERVKVEGGSERREGESWGEKGHRADYVISRSGNSRVVALLGSYRQYFPVAFTTLHLSFRQ